MNCLRNISSADAIYAIVRAQRRIVLLSPGIDEAIATELAMAWQRLGPEAVTVILDIDPEVIRLGYGTEAGLDIIQNVAASLAQAVCHQAGIRLCVLVADDTTLIFSPTPLLIEAGSTQPERPNGISLQTTPKVLGDELGIGDEGAAKREIGLNIVNPAAIAEVKNDLRENPPLKFDVSRKERVFNAKLEFVELELEGCFVSRHTVTIPAELVGMVRMDKKTRDKLRSSFRLVEESDILDAKKKISEKALRNECQRIRKKFLRPVSGYGTLILRANREAFETEVAGLRERVEGFRQALRSKLKDVYAENAKRLTKALLPAVAKRPPEEWTGVLGANPTRQQIQEMLRQTLLSAFGDPETLLREMRVNLNFKGVTYSTLTDTKFIEAAQAQFPNLKLHEEYDAARGANPPRAEPPFVQCSIVDL